MVWRSCYLYINGLIDFHSLYGEHMLNEAIEFLIIHRLVTNRFKLQAYGLEMGVYFCIGFID